MEKFILALDQGTTSSRAIIFDHKGTIKSLVQKEFKQYFPQPGWVEHDAEEIWQSQKEVAIEVLKKAGVTAENIAAIGITNQRETTVIWNRETGKPICNAIVWQDRRTSGYCDQLKARGLEATIQDKTGLVIDAYFSGSKINWILKNIEGARELAENGKLAFGTVDSWLVWNFTGGKNHVSDVTNASRTLLFNIHNVEWDEELLNILEVPQSLLPEVKSCSEKFGDTLANIFGSSILITGIAGDQLYSNEYRRYPSKIK
jgi:glycerol kinase